MRRILIVIAILLFISSSFPYEKKSIIERYTNYQCGPCASVNNAWYNAATANLVGSETVSHIVYNVNWPGPNDPMYLLNAAENSKRWGYYGVNSVPWIVVNGTTISVDEPSMQNAVTNGNAQFAPFKIILTPERFHNNVINVKVKIIRDPTDVTVFDTVNTKLRVGLTEKRVTGVGGLESAYFSITRRILPNADGALFDIPLPGDSVEVELMYVPSQEFLQNVNLDSLRVVSFIQNDLSKMIYQSEMTDVVSSNNLNAAFSLSDDFGGAPLTVSFTDYSTGSDSSAALQYEWDFNNDGTIDSQDPSPEFTYSEEGFYTVKLTVKEGLNSHTRLMNNLITIITSVADILVVNGIDYRTSTYIPEMQRFYGGSAAYGYHQVDVWDLFGDQGFDYFANPLVQKVHLFKRDVPLAAMKIYDKVIWIGNNYSGDIAFFKPSTVIDYLGLGGNFLLTSRLGSSFFSTELRTYAGISGFTGDLQIDSLVALDSNLVNMRVIPGNLNNLVHLFTISDSSTISIFKYPIYPNHSAGFRMQKENEGAFIFITGRPYRYDTAASAFNYSYIIDNWMTGDIVGVKENRNSVPEDFTLSQNYPNPFNPVTSIKYNVAKTGLVRIKVYDILGNEVTDLINTVKEPGEYVVRFDASGLSSGIYLCRMEAPGVNISKKMILLK